MSSSSNRIRAYVALFAALAASASIAAPARAESGRYNLHLSAMGPLPTAGEVAFDWQLARPWALELAAGGGAVTDFGNNTDGLFYATFGARLRLADDESGYLDEGGSIAGHYWIAAHAGFFVTEYTGGFMADVATGYAFSIVAPVSIGPFVKAGVGVTDQAMVPFVSGGIEVTIEFDPLREPQLDSDNDGVFDRTDRCPATPAGQSVNAVGCGDADRDGVYDDADRCAGTPYGESVNTVGCGDEDDDGVFDDADACPGTPPESNVDARGCVVLPPALVLEGIEFQYDSAIVDLTSEPVLIRAAQALRDNPDARIEIGGHTDDVGSRSYNQDLSLQRAQAVRDWLVAHGIEASRLEVRGYGSSQPRVPNTDDASRARNRRIELRQIGR